MYRIGHYTFTFTHTYNTHSLLSIWQPVNSAWNNIMYNRLVKISQTYEIIKFTLEFMDIHAVPQRN